MHILFISNSTSEVASFRYRVHQYIGHLAKEGIKCSVARPNDVPLSSIGRLRQYDAVFMQKALCSVSWILAASLAAKHLIFDFDDAIWTTPMGNRTWWTTAQTGLRLRAILSRSSCAVVGNSYLAEYASKYCEDVVVIPTCVDTAYYRPGTPHKDDGRLRLGWVGSKPNLMYLEQLEPVFRRLSHTTNASIELVVICDKEYVSPNLPTEFIPWTLEGGPGAIQSLDIGIMPLKDDEWTRGKCGFKTIQYMSCGVPSVSANVGANREIVDDGRNGFLASSEDEWTEKLSRLVKDSTLRYCIGNEGRRTVEENYSIEVGARLLIDTLRRVSSR